MEACCAARDSGLQCAQATKQEAMAAAQERNSVARAHYSLARTAREHEAAKAASTPSEGTLGTPLLVTMTLPLPSR